MIEQREFSRNRTNPRVSLVLLPRDRPLRRVVRMRGSSSASYLLSSESGSRRLDLQFLTWSSTAAMVLLATGLAGAVLRWVEFRNLSGLMSGPPSASLVLVFEITGVLLLATALVGSTATVVALFGLTRPPNSG